MPASSLYGQRRENHQHGAHANEISSLDEMIEELLLMLPRMKKQQEGKIRDWIGQIRADKPRYIRDQLIIISKAIFHRDSEIIVSAIAYCIYLHNFSCTIFNDILDTSDKYA